MPLEGHTYSTVLPHLAREQMSGCRVSCRRVGGLRAQYFFVFLSRRSILVLNFTTREWERDGLGRLSAGRRAVPRTPPGKPPGAGRA